MPQKTLLVANPTAQSGRNARRIGKARAFLDAAGIAHDFLPTEPAGRTVAAVAKRLHDGEYHTVVYMGGDGTFAEAAKGILEAGKGRDVRLGMLPTGTANDQGKSFGLGAGPSHLRRNVTVLAEGHERPLDAGHIATLDPNGNVIHEDWFFDSAGWGISPRVLHLRNEDKKAIEGVPVLRDLWKGKLVYAGALLRTFLASYIDGSTFGAEIDADGKHYSWERLTDLVVKGTHVYGGAWIFDRNAQPDDGKFEVVPFTGKRDWISKAIVHLDGSPFTPESLAKLGVTHSKGFAASHIDITFQRSLDAIPLEAQIDGEELPTSPRVRIEVVRHALRLVVPRDHAAGAR